MAKKNNQEQSAIDVSERMVPEVHKHHTIYGEHYIRYEAAKKLVKNKIVLDIASGSGYGTKMLAKHAEKVYGVDVSQEAIEYAVAHFNAGNVKYLVGNGESIPLEDESVDIVISFETIEHIKDYKKFMKELKRVLRKDGLLLISTPNELEFAEGNHYHLHEFEEKELADLIQTEFSQMKMYYQGDWVYSALLPQDFISKEGASVIKTFQLAPLEKAQYLYFYALCSNREISETIDSLGATSEHWSARQIQEEGAKNSNKQKLTTQHVNNLEELLKAREEEIRVLNEEVAHMRKSTLWKTRKKLSTIKRKIVN